MTFFWSQTAIVDFNIFVWRFQVVSLNPLLAFGQNPLTLIYKIQQQLQYTKNKPNLYTYI
jgi:hypothetical protein